MSPATARRLLVTNCALTTSCLEPPTFTLSRQEDPATMVDSPQSGTGSAEASCPPAFPDESSSRLLLSREESRRSVQTQQRWAEQSIHPFLALYTSASYNSLISCLLLPASPLHRSAHRCCARASAMAFDASPFAISSLLTSLEASHFSNTSNRRTNTVNPRLLNGRDLTRQIPNQPLEATTSLRASEEIDAVLPDNLRRSLLKLARIREAHRMYENQWRIR
jgi:hypothetical protein